MIIWANFVQVLEQHLLCAAYEHSLSVPYDEQFFGSSLEGVVITLKSKGYLSSDLSSNPPARIWNYIGAEVFSPFG